MNAVVGVFTVTSSEEVLIPEGSVFGYEIESGDLPEIYSDKFGPHIYKKPIYSDVIGSEGESTLFANLPPHHSVNANFQLVYTRRKSLDLCPGLGTVRSIEYDSENAFLSASKFVLINM